MFHNKPTKQLINMSMAAQWSVDGMVEKINLIGGRKCERREVEVKEARVIRLRAKRTGGRGSDDESGWRSRRKSR